MSEIKNELEDIARRMSRACNAGVSISQNGVNVNREIIRLLEIVGKQEDRIIELERKATFNSLAHELALKGDGKHIEGS